MLLYAISVWPISAAVRLRHSRTLCNTDPSTHTVSARCLRQALRASAFYIKRKSRLVLGVQITFSKFRIHACPAFQLFTNVGWCWIKILEKRRFSLSFCKPRGLQQSHESEKAWLWEVWPPFIKGGCSVLIMTDMTSRVESGIRQMGDGLTQPRASDNCTWLLQQTQRRRGVEWEDNGRGHQSISGSAATLYTECLTIAVIGASCHSNNLAPIRRQSFCK